MAQRTGDDRTARNTTPGRGQQRHGHICVHDPPQFEFALDGRIFAGPRRQDCLRLGLRGVLQAYELCDVPHQFNFFAPGARFRAIFDDE
jgi:hypothetical protein